MITVTAIHSYPVKSCRGIQHDSALVTAAGLKHDREWMFVSPGGRFITQREEPRLARVEVALSGDALQLSVAGAGGVAVPLDLKGPRTRVTIWRDNCAAIDQGDEPANWISSLLGRELRLVRFDPADRRRSDPAWTGDLDGYSQFADGYAMLVVSRASLDKLNSWLAVPVPMERFRPNLVLDGLPPFGEDELRDITCDGVRLRFVKPCIRCVITTTDQRTGERSGEEPLRALQRFRWNAELHGVAFGQNAIVVDGVDQSLRQGGVFEARPR